VALREFTPDGTIDAVAVSLAWNLLDLLDEMLGDSPIGIPALLADHDEIMAAKVAVTFYGAKYSRTLRAILLLTLYGQSREVVGLSRFVHDYWVSAAYYDAFPEQALLWIASEALRQRDDIKRIAAFAPEVATDPEKQQQASEVEAMCKEAYAQHPGLITSKGKDWSAPEPHEMLLEVFKHWRLRDGESTADAELERERDKAHFFNSRFPAQEIHGTPNVLSLTLVYDRDGALKMPETRHESPNSLLLSAVMIGARIVEIMGQRLGLNVETQMEAIAAATGYFMTHDIE
jgi:hypothetical protein